MTPADRARAMFDRLEAAGCQLVVRDGVVLVRAGEDDRGFIAANKRLCVDVFREREKAGRGDAS